MNTDKKYQKYVDMLKDKKFRVTEQRLQILKTIDDNYNEHLTNEEIHNLVRKVNPDIGLATVYRTTQLLEELGVITVLSIGDGKERYEMRKEEGEHEHTHHHLICTMCGKVEEVMDHVLLKPLEDKIEKEFKFRITDHNLRFTGVCSECCAKEQEANE